MKLKYEFAVSQVCGAWCAVPVGKSANIYKGVICLNEPSADMMKLLKDDITEEQLVQKMLQEYDVEEQELRKDVHDFIEQLKAENVLS